MIKVGIIGLGRIGALLEQDKFREKPCTHLGAWRSLPVEITAICDTNFELAKEIRRSYDLKSDVISDPVNMVMGYRFDIISVATPVETHGKIVELIARHRAAKVVFCEKPISDSVAYADQMIINCRENGIKLAINHTRRWDKLYIAVKEILKRKEIGEPIAAVGYYSGERLNDGVHMVDIRNWFEILNFTKVNIKNNEADYLIFEVDILCQKGRIRILNNGQNWELHRSEESDRYEGFRELHKNDPFDIDYSEKTPILLACEQLIRCVNSDEQPYCTGLDGFKALSGVLNDQTLW